MAGALTGSIIGGAPGVILGAVLPPILVRFSAAAEARQRNVESVIEVAGEFAGLTGDELADWMGADVRRMSFFQDVVASAWSTFDEDKLRLPSPLDAPAAVGVARSDGTRPLARITGTSGIYVQVLGRDGG